MNNSKWRRVLQNVADSGLALPVSEWCFLGNSERRHSMATPSSDDCLVDGSGIADTSATGPFLFRDVHFLHWPRLYKCDEKKLNLCPQQQDIDRLYGILMQSGELDITRDHNGVTVWGYRVPEQTGKVNATHQILNVLSRRFLLLILLLSSFILHLSASAQSGLKIQLVSEVAAIVPGKPFTVGLWLQHPEGAHTYWRFPGIVGVPTQMKWKLPRGWKAGELTYPEPERTFMYQIKAQGFDRDVMLRTEITPPANLKVGESVTLTGAASWMCCGKSCNPGSLDLSLTLPVAAAAELNTKWHKLLDAERSRAEQSSDAWISAASENGDAITLVLKPATAEARLSKSPREADKIIAFTEDGWFDTDKPQTIVRHADGAVTVTLIKADTYLGSRPPKTLRVILRNEEGWLQGGRLRCLQIAPRIVR